MLQVVSLVFLVWIYAVAIHEYLTIFTMPLGVRPDLTILALSLSFLGAGLGIGFFLLAQLKLQIHKFSILLIAIAIVLFLFIGSFIIEPWIYRELMLFLVRIGIIFFLCALPITGTYGVMARQQQAVLATGLAIFFFFIFSKVLFGMTVFEPNQLELYLLFFIFLVSYMEVGIRSMQFNSTLQKIALNDQTDETMLSRFNDVFNRYLIHISLVVFIAYGLTVGILWFNNYLIASGSGDIIPSLFNSIVGIWILVLIMIVGAFVLWYLIPHERVKKA